uniref:Kazal-like domain-containing protein n=1 Tax=Timema monikensis TaxID=170555 RepID=A0A7R9HRZ4_9NEOP|nr:unnamed protein product [Timema monikensis]
MVGLNSLDKFLKMFTTQRHSLWSWDLLGELDISGARPEIPANTQNTPAQYEERKHIHKHRQLYLSSFVTARRKLCSTELEQTLPIRVNLCVERRKDLSTLFSRGLDVACSRGGSMCDLSVSCPKKEGVNPRSNLMEQRCNSVTGRDAVPGDQRLSACSGGHGVLFDSYTILQHIRLQWTEMDTRLYCLTSDLSFPVTTGAGRIGAILLPSIIACPGPLGSLHLAAWIDIQDRGTSFVGVVYLVWRDYRLTGEIRDRVSQSGIEGSRTATSRGEDHIFYLITGMLLLALGITPGDVPVFSVVCFKGITPGDVPVFSVVCFKGITPGDVPVFSVVCFKGITPGDVPVFSVVCFKGITPGDVPVFSVVCFKGITPGDVPVFSVVCFKGITPGDVPVFSVVCFKGITPGDVPVFSVVCFKGITPGDVPVFSVVCFKGITPGDVPVFSVVCFKGITPGDVPVFSVVCFKGITPGDVPVFSVVCFKGITPGDVPVFSVVCFKGITPGDVPVFSVVCFKGITPGDVPVFSVVCFKGITPGDVPVFSVVCFKGITPGDVPVFSVVYFKGITPGDVPVLTVVCFKGITPGDVPVFSVVCFKGITPGDVPVFSVVCLCLVHGQDIQFHERLPGVDRQYISTDLCLSAAKNMTYEPLCGSDGQTFHNVQAFRCYAAFFEVRQLSVRYGACVDHPEPSHCALAFVIWRRVCGQDNRTYSSVWELMCEAQRMSTPISVQYEGPCRHLCPVSMLYDPVCSSDMVEYPNIEALHCDAARRPYNNLSLLKEGPCPGKEEPICDGSVQDGREVCGSNSITYSSINQILCIRKHNPYLSILHDGACTLEDIKFPKENAKICYFADNVHMQLPVCGTDNVTYSNPFIMKCAALRGHISEGTDLQYVGERFSSSQSSLAFSLFLQTHLCLKRLLSCSHGGLAGGLVLQSFLALRRCLISSQGNLSFRLLLPP